MTIEPITDTRPACYGVQCPVHADCARYAAVESTSWAQTIGTCDDGQGGRPRFVPIKQEQEAQP